MAGPNAAAGEPGGRRAGTRNPGTPGPAAGEAEVLAGGTANAGAVLRRGDAVERPAPPHAHLLHAHLRALRDRGFADVPVPLEVSGRRERLSYVPGEVAVAPYPAWAWSDAALHSVGALLRRMHDAAAALPADRSAGWPTELADPEPESGPEPVSGPGGEAGPGPVVCHNDVCLENVVFRDGRAAALIDFDLAAPGSGVGRGHDRPLLGPDARARRPRPRAPPARAGRRLRARTGRAALPGVIERATAVCRAFVERRVAQGDAAYTAAYEESGRAVWDRHQSWLAAHRRTLTTALLAD